MNHRLPQTKKPVPVGSFMLRRVFRQDHLFICGICREKHDSSGEANQCLETCWKIVLNRAPWSAVKKIGRLKFACIYCQRIYNTTDEASACAEDCALKMSISGFDGRNLETKRQRRVFEKSTAKLAVNFPFKIGGKGGDAGDDPHDDVASHSPDDHANNHATAHHAGAGDTGTSNAASVSAASAAAASAAKSLTQSSPAADEDSSKAVRDRTKKFERAGSKYVCVICQVKYFTRDEVERCFDAHSGSSMEKHQNSGI